MSSQHRYYPALDGVRAFAALLVIVFHTQQFGVPIPGPVNFGQTGVDLFFVLSGFLITSGLLNARHGDWSEVRTFYGRRSLRIFPLYYGCLALCAAFGAIYSWPFWVYLQNFWISFRLPIYGPPHFWSLAVEEQFYLFWPFLVLFAPRRHLLKLLWFMILLVIMCRFAMALDGRDTFSFTPTRLDGLAAGGILAVLQSHGVLQRWRSVLLSNMVISAILLAGLSAIYRQTNNPYFITVKYALLAAMYSGLIGWLLCTPESRTSIFFSLRPLRYIGRISYGLYVWHPFVLGITFHYLRNYSYWVQAAIGIPVVFAVATVSWYGFERPILKLKESWVPESRHTPRAPLSV